MAELSLAMFLLILSVVTVGMTAMYIATILTDKSKRKQVMERIKTIKQSINQ